MAYCISFADETLDICIYVCYTDNVGCEKISRLLPRDFCFYMFDLRFTAYTIALIIRFTTKIKIETTAAYSI